MLTALRGRRLRSLKVRRLGVLLCAVGIIFVAYQLFVVRILDQADRLRTLARTQAKPLRAISDPDGDFLCLLSRKVIKKSQVDDDYCDCPLDGHDEPTTNACTNGTFICRHRSKKVEIPSSRVNDGICDCCDGSDEWNSIESPIHLDLAVQKKIGSYLTPCPNTCAR